MPVTVTIALAIDPRKFGETKMSTVINGVTNATPCAFSRIIHLFIYVFKIQPTSSRWTPRF